MWDQKKDKTIQIAGKIPTFYYHFLKTQCEPKEKSGAMLSAAIVYN